MKRDPYLPSPEVCDWLLSQEWSSSIPETNIIHSPIGPGGCYRSSLFDYQYSFVGIGADGLARIYMNTDDMQILQKDAEARQAGTYEATGSTPEDLHPEEALADQICKTIAGSEIETSPIAAAGAAFTAGILMIANHYGVKFETAEDLEQ